ncbi:MAG: polyphosphate:AMP phosphotransferase [Oscillospiraceae bacterium]
MLKNTAKAEKLPKEEYKKEIAALQEKLSVLQHTVKENGVPVVIVLDGWGAAGKGTLLAEIIETMDPRNYKVKSTLTPTPQEARFPFLQRHWASIPQHGLFSIFDRSSYPEASIDRLEAGISKKEAFRRMDAINMFERQLADDGTLLVKLFLHISKKEQKNRLDALAAKKATGWRATRQDFERNRQYEKYHRMFDDMLEYTNTAYAPWHVINTKNRHVAAAEALGLIVGKIEEALAQKAKAAKPRKAPAKKEPLSSGPFTIVRTPALQEVPLTLALTPEEYKPQLRFWQEKLKKLHNEIYLRKIPVVIAYEGWDAAGKGGNIKRLTNALDPRGYEVVPIASPTPPEKNRQFLWRFWNHLPKNGHIAIFDRTWYGRVLVERVEGFAAEVEWRRAYREINEFEQQLAEWGAVVVKFWLQIDKDEQLRRFNDRQNTPEKQWKITEEDWRNREKWDAYEAAVNDMLLLTSTDFAPWTIVESQNKPFARIKALQTVSEAIEARLAQK